MKSGTRRKVGGKEGKEGLIRKATKKICLSSVQRLITWLDERLKWSSRRWSMVRYSSCTGESCTRIPTKPRYVVTAMRAMKDQRRLQKTATHVSHWSKTAWHAHTSQSWENMGLHKQKRTQTHYFTPKPHKSLCNTHAHKHTILHMQDVPHLRFSSSVPICLRALAGIFSKALGDFRWQEKAICRNMPAKSPRYTHLENITTSWRAWVECC